MDLGLKGKVALVTGAGSPIGFGRAIAVTLAKEGADIVVSDINLNWAEKTATEIKALGQKAMAVKVDIANSSQVNDMVRAAIATMGKVDIMVNTAGHVGAEGTFYLTSEDDWDQTIDLMLKGPMNCTKAVIPHMLEHKYGKIVNMVSDTWETGRGSLAVYSSCEGGVAIFTRSVAYETADRGLNINCLAPGLSATGFLQGADGKPRDSERVEYIAKYTPLKRLTHPQDVANLAAFLVSDLASDIVGQIISVNGGFAMMLRM